MKNPRSLAPSEPGALAGFALDCPTCGMEIRSSLETAVVHDLASHLEWHARKDGAR